MKGCWRPAPSPSRRRHESRVICVNEANQTPRSKTRSRSGIGDGDTACWPALGLTSSQPHSGSNWTCSMLKMASLMTPRVRPFRCLVGPDRTVQSLRRRWQRWLRWSLLRSWKAGTTRATAGVPSLPTRDKRGCLRQSLQVTQTRWMASGTWSDDCARPTCGQSSAAGRERSSQNSRFLGSRC